MVSGARKMRLNVVAVDSKQMELGRMLHVVNAKLLNHTRALLPNDELTGTILRDGETVYAVCGVEEEQPKSRAAPRAPSPEPVRLTAAEQQRRMDARLLRPDFGKGGGEMMADDKEQFAVSSGSEPADSEEELSDDDNGPKPPVPSEKLEPSAKLGIWPGKAAAKVSKGGSAYARASDAAHQIMGRSDWLVEHLTPRLREFIWARFQEAGLERGVMKLPKHDDRYITVLMKPLPRVGAEQPIAPVQYSVARVDVAEFENLARKQVQQARLQMEYLEKCRIGLEGLRKKGHKPTEVCKTLLPFKWRDAQEHEALLQEALGHTFNCVENFRPVILVDTAGIQGEQLQYVQAALKRLLYGFIAGKSLFNFVYFPKEARGLARPWATGMVPPAASSLREAEEFLETLEPAHRVNLLDGIKTALSLECDAIYLLSSGYDRRYDPNFLLQAVRSLNLREVSIFTIGIDVNTDQDEVFLRRLAESNHGDYKAKALVQQATASLGGGAAGMRKPPVHHPRTTKMTIGGQAKIVDVIFE